MTLKHLVLPAIAVLQIGCDIPRPTDVICHCQVNPDKKMSELSRLSQSPENFIHSEIRELVRNPESDYFGTPEGFDAATIHWYQNDMGESLACVVFDGSNHVGAMFTLAADKEQTKPIDFRLMGIPFGRDPSFWEGCSDAE